MNDGGNNLHSFLIPCCVLQSVEQHGLESLIVGSVGEIEAVGVLEHIAQESRAACKNMSRLEPLLDAPRISDIVPQVVDFWGHVPGRLRAHDEEQDVNQANNVVSPALGY